jgi:hypothetical protein
VAEAVESVVIKRSTKGRKPKSLQTAGDEAVYCRVETAKLVTKGEDHRRLQREAGKVYKNDASQRVAPFGTWSSPTSGHGVASG